MDSGTPTMREVDGRLVIDWPDPRPRTIEMSADLLEVLVERINRAEHP